MPLFIREVKTEAQQYYATVQFDQGATHEVVVTAPFAEFAEQQEQELEWYFERYLACPFIEQVRFGRVPATIQAYGESLFNQLFAERRLNAEYQRHSDFSIEVIGSPTFHHLHWEALKDPDKTHPFALHQVITRKSPQFPESWFSIADSPVLKVLLVVARPHGRRDVGYRTISRPLIELIHNAKLPVQIDILRPATYQALCQQLESKGKGFYHMLHFDGHGSVLTYQQCEKLQQPDKVEASRIWMDGRYGRGLLEKFEEKKAFLSFAAPQIGQADLVEACEIADLLSRYELPIVILNACQSAKQLNTATETSLGSRLLQAGVKMVLAMAYSVTVSAARVFMQNFYEELLARTDLAIAVRRARLELKHNPERLAYFNERIRLEDWLLPVVYQQSPQHLPLREFTAPEESTYLEQQTQRYQEPKTSYGFFGRDVEVLEIEQRLLQRNLLLLRGMGGTGKTTLLHHLAALGGRRRSLSRKCIILVMTRGHGTSRK